MCIIQSTLKNEAHHSSRFILSIYRQKSQFKYKKFEAAIKSGGLVYSYVLFARTYGFQATVELSEPRRKSIFDFALGEPRTWEPGNFTSVSLELGKAKSSAWCLMS